MTETVYKQTIATSHETARVYHNKQRIDEELGQYCVCKNYTKRMTAMQLCENTEFCSINQTESFRNWRE